MDIYGRPSGIAAGGIIVGDLDVLGNVSVEGDLDVSGTLTADTLVVRESIETKDHLIHLGLDNPADVSNMGTFWEYNDGGRRYGGLIRDRESKQVKLFTGAMVKPTATSGISALSGGNLRSDLIENIQLQTDVVIHNSPSTPGQGFGAYAQNGELTYIRQDNRVSNTLGAKIQSRSSLGYNGMLYRSSNGTLTVPTATNAGNELMGLDVLGYDGNEFKFASNITTLATENWTPSAHGSSVNLTYIPNGTTLLAQGLKVSSNGFEVGMPGTGYTLPFTRGTINQTLVSNASGQATWQSPSSAPTIGDALIQLDQPSSYTNRVDRFNRTILPDAFNATYALVAGVFTQRPVYAEHLDLWIVHANSGGIGAILHSADTVSWSVAVLPDLPTAGYCSYSKEKKLCVWMGFNIALTQTTVSRSTDGITWTAPTTIAQVCNIAEPATYIARYDRFYQPCNTGAFALIVSSDWITFTTIGIPRKIFDMVYNERVITTTGDSGGLYSLDGTTFTPSNLPSSQHSISYNNDLDIFHFISTSNLYWHSKDGITWTNVPNATVGLPNGIINHHYIPELQCTIASTATALYYAMGHPSAINQFRGPIITTGTSGNYLTKEGFYYDKMRGALGINTTVGYHVGTVAAALSLSEFASGTELDINSRAGFDGQVRFKNNGVPQFDLFCSAGGTFAMVNNLHSPSPRFVYSVNPTTSRTTINADLALKGSLEMDQVATPVITGTSGFIFNSADRPKWLPWGIKYTNDLSGVPLANPVCYAEAHMQSNFDAIIFTNAVEWRPVVNVGTPFVFGLTNLSKYGAWTIVGNSIKFNALANPDRVLKCKIDVCLSAINEDGKDSEQRDFGIFTGNPITLRESSRQTMAVGAGREYPKAISMTCFAAVFPNHNIQIQVRNPMGDNRRTTVKDMTVSIMEISDG